MYLDSSRYPQPARHELCPCCVRPIAARLSSFWQLLYLYLDSSRYPQPARHELCPCCVRPIAARLSSFWQLLYLYLDSSRFPQPARHEPCPCSVRPIAARLSSFWQLLYLYLPLMQNRELLMQFPILLCLPLVRLFFSDPRGMNYIHPSRDQSLKGSPIVKSYFTSTFLPFTM